MIDYYIRCARGDVPALRALGAALGLLTEQGGVWAAAAPHAYVELGELERPTGHMVAGPDGPIAELRAVLAPDGLPYWHANLRFAGSSLFEHAQAVLAARPSPELAAALEPEAFARFFVVDEAGEATRPDRPAVVFA